MKKLTVKVKVWHSPSTDEVEKAYATDAVELHTRIKVRLTETEFGADGEETETTRLVDTTVGRALLSLLLPKGLSFDLVNQKHG